MIFSQLTEVISNIALTKTVHHLCLRLPEESPEFKPGQFFMLKHQDANGEAVERSYSVAHWPGNDRLEFIIRIEEQGKMTQRVKYLQAGDTITIKGPFGHFGKNFGPKNKQFLFLAGGVGLSPIRSLIHKWNQEFSDIPSQLVYGFRSSDDFLFKEELETYENLQLTPIASRPDEQWTGLSGYIHDHLPQLVQAGDTQSYICGPPAMVKAARNTLLNLGFERTQIHVEAW